jgi:hypothetical protein
VEGLRFCEARRSAPVGFSCGNGTKFVFKSKTLFVVGAGASFEFGLPTGNELKSKIAKKLDITFSDGYNQNNGDFKITEAFRSLTSSQTPPSKDISPYVHAAWQIRDAMPQSLSIDNFIDAHQQDNCIRICGKLAIARTILQAERESLLYTDMHSNDRLSPDKYMNTWLGQFALRLTENVRKEDINTILDNVIFIIFNYDRCVETALVHILRNYYFVDQGVAQEIVRRIAIFHPYGMVGSLPWQGGNSVAFGEDVSGPRLLEVSGRIKTFTEQTEEGDYLNKIKSAYQSANKIIYLGFGYHALNMELLKPKTSASATEIYGTTYQLSGSEHQVVQRVVIHSLGDRAPSDMQLASLTCVQMLQQYGRAICLP